MILHVVLFQFSADATGEQIAQAGAALLAMEGPIAEIRAITWGPNLGPSEGEYSHVLTVTLDDMDAVQRYLDHPIHRETVAKWIHPIRAGRLAVDIEMPGVAR